MEGGWPAGGGDGGEGRGGRVADGAAGELERGVGRMSLEQLVPLEKAAVAEVVAAR